MKQHIAHIALLVDDYDEAIRFYIDKLNFRLIEDTRLGETKRWVLIGPVGKGTCNILLVKAVNPEQRNKIGNQTGGRVFLFLHTDNFDRDFRNLIEQQVKIVRPPMLEPYGKVAVFEDLYGNLWDLVGPGND